MTPKPQRTGRGFNKLKRIVAMSSLLVAVSLQARAGTHFMALAPVPFRSKDQSVVALSSPGTSTLETRQILVSLTRTDGLPQNGSLLVAFDRKSGVYWWDLSLFGLSERLDEAAARNRRALGKSLRFYADSTRIIAFDGRVSFYIRESAEHASNLNDAEKKAFVNAWHSLLADRPYPSGMPVNLFQGVDPAVFINVESGAASLCEFQNLSRDKNDWIVTMRCRETVRLVLDEEFELKNWSRINP